MTDEIRIENDDILVDVIPKLGGSLAGFDLKRGDERLPIFRRWTRESDSPRTFASIPMVPWFARISGGGIGVDGTFYPIARNDPEDTHPLHGDGWRSPWEVTVQDAEGAELRLRSTAIPPFDYTATLTYRVAGPTLEVALAIRNEAGRALPYGMGLHPWFPRTPDVTVNFRSDGTWLEQPPKLPTTVETAPVPATWDFNHPRRLPDEFIDNSFTGFDGKGRILWPGRGCAVAIDADPSIRLSHLYAPGPQFPFFCFEQVTNMIDAFNIPGTAEQTGLRILAPGEETRMSVRYTAMLL